MGCASFLPAVFAAVHLFVLVFVLVFVFGLILILVLVLILIVHVAFLQYGNTVMPLE